MGTGPLKSDMPETKRVTWRRLAASALPGRVVEQVRELRSLSRVEQRAYLGNALRRVVSRASDLPRDISRDGPVLFVCYGNIIRSALAEALFRRHAVSLGINKPDACSAGLSARPGREADARAVAAGKALGVDLTAHRAQRVTDSLVDGASIIFVMDRLNEAQLLARFPRARRKVRRLGSLAIERSSDIIPDPYVLDADAVTAAAKRIDVATSALVAAFERLGRRS